MVCSHKVNYIDMVSDDSYQYFDLQVVDFDSFPNLEFLTLGMGEATSRDDYVCVHTISWDHPDEPYDNIDVILVKNDVEHKYIFKADSLEEKTCRYDGRTDLPLPDEAYRALLAAGYGWEELDGLDRMYLLWADIRNFRFALDSIVPPEVDQLFSGFDWIRDTLYKLDELVSLRFLYSDVTEYESMLNHIGKYSFPPEPTHSGQSPGALPWSMHSQVDPVSSDPFVGKLTDYVLGPDTLEQKRKELDPAYDLHGEQATRVIETDDGDVYVDLVTVWGCERFNYSHSLFTDPSSVEEPTYLGSPIVGALSDAGYDVSNLPSLYSGDHPGSTIVGFLNLLHALEEYQWTADPDSLGYVDNLIKTLRAHLTPLLVAVEVAAIAPEPFTKIFDPVPPNRLTPVHRINLLQEIVRSLDTEQYQTLEERVSDIAEKRGLKGSEFGELDSLNEQLHYFV